MLEGCQWFENVSWGEIKRFMEIYIKFNKCGYLLNKDCIFSKINQ